MLTGPGSLKWFYEFIEPLWTRLLVSETPAQYYGRYILARHEHICGDIGHHLNIDRNSASEDLSGGELEREHTKNIAPCGYNYTHKYRTYRPGRSVSMRTEQNVPGGYLRSVLPGHTNINTGHLAPAACEHAYGTFPRADNCFQSYRTPCSWRRSQDTALERAGHSVSGVLSSGIPDTSLGGALCKRNRSVYCPVQH